MVLIGAIAIYGKVTWQATDSDHISNICGSRNASLQIIVFSYIFKEASVIKLQQSAPFDLVSNRASRY